VRGQDAAPPPNPNKPKKPGGQEEILRSVQREDANVRGIIEPVGERRRARIGRMGGEERQHNASRVASCSSILGEGGERKSDAIPRELLHNLGGGGRESIRCYRYRPGKKEKGKRGSTTGSRHREIPIKNPSVSAREEGTDSSGGTGDWKDEPGYD